MSEAKAEAVRIYEAMFYKIPIVDHGEGEIEDKAAKDCALILINYLIDLDDNDQKWYKEVKAEINQI